MGEQKTERQNESCRKYVRLTVPCLHLSLGLLCSHEHVVCVTLDVYAEITFVEQNSLQGHKTGANLR